MVRLHAGFDAAGTDTHIAVIAVNTMLASAAALSALTLFMKVRFGTRLGICATECWRAWWPSPRLALS